MFGYLPKTERNNIKFFFETNYLYHEKGKINWGVLNTVEKLSKSIRLNRVDPYSKIERLKKEKQSTGNYYLNFVNGTLYIRLVDFFDIDKINDRIIRGSEKKIILNLSENSGGSVQEMLKLAKLLVSNRVTLCLKYKSHVHVYDIPENSLAQGKELFILTSKDTISSAEILAFMIKEGNKSSILAGEKTYGKGEGQVTLTSRKYNYRFSLTAFEWTINGLNCKELQRKYEEFFDNRVFELSMYMDKLM